MDLKVGDLVWLIEFDNGDEVVPREQVIVTKVHDDSIEFTTDEDGRGPGTCTLDQVEGYVVVH